MLEGREGKGTDKTAGFLEVSADRFLRPSESNKTGNVPMRRVLLTIVEVERR